ncbi:ABC transporter ATP-binding protein/permease [Gordonia neofelifaecis]|uniref:Mycobactin import ATP-binding/permease protein IrtA n=1 Tax=Gordonia neofelifaecis NRRL B-59395 TaxID=644548 RepID=F1YPB9_9ACTN|nr:ATP-binding cassette domain-containing protein [Gordonia neofelifaecis]EGD53439.1 transmembrane ATP-binding protein ABC transporter [Gordonia neofelifaecis NRRL B-59395]
MGKGFQGAMLRALGAKNHPATVTGVEWVTEHVVRIDFQCDEILHIGGEKPAAWIRAWFPDVGGGSKFHQRGYTLLDPDPGNGTFGICFLVHEPAGPASMWARTAQVGDELLMTRLGGDGYDVGGDGDAPRGYLLMGDVAAWPAIIRVIDHVADDVPIRVVIEYENDDDRDLPMPDRAGLVVDWVPTRSDRRALTDAIGHDDYRGWHTWVTAESKATRLAKGVLSVNHEQNKATMHTQAYWMAGRAMGKQIDTATESEVVADTVAVDAGARPTPADAEMPVRASTPVEPAESVLKPALPALIVAGLFALVLAVLAVVPLILFAELARLLVEGADRQELIDVAVAAVIVLAVGAVGSAVLITVLHVYDQNYAAALRRRVLGKLTRLPLGWFAGRRSSEVKKLVTDDISSLHYLVTHAVPDLVAAVVTPLVILGYLFSVSWALALVLLLPVILYVVAMGRLATADKPRLEQKMRWDATLPGDAERYISTQQVSRVFGDRATTDLPAQLRRVTEFMKDWQRATIDTKSVILQLNRPTTSMVVVALAGTALITTGQMNAVAILPFLILGTSFGDRLLAASYAIGGLREGMNGKTSLDLLLSAGELEGVEPSGAEVVDPTGPAHVQLRGVTFGYTPGRPVISDLTLDLRAGGTTAVVGPSGAGKSTVAALVARLWDPDSGAVLLDGVDLRDIPEAELRRRIAVVLQDVQLIRGTIAENIALGVPGVDRAAIREAARAAFIADVIESLPDGYDTIVDRDSLSGGQRQRLAIARALLGDPRLVVLDEATAAADPDSEWEVRQGLSKLLAGRTVLVVAHRLHTIADADHIVVLDGGRIVEQGTGSRLLELGGRYAAMTAQAQEALR